MVLSHIKPLSCCLPRRGSYTSPETGEAQKIDRIINAFGRHYYSSNEEVFRSGDAAYVLAYSVIMLNTDQHNSQVGRCCAKPTCAQPEVGGWSQMLCVEGGRGHEGT